MKKEINEILKTGGYYRLNNIAVLHRWTEDALGGAVDGLAIEFDSINRVAFSPSMVDIKSRDYESVIEECASIIEQHLQAVTKQLMKQLRNGYRNVGKDGVSQTKESLPCPAGKR